MEARNQDGGARRKDEMIWRPGSKIRGRRKEKRIWRLETEMGGVRKKGGQT